MIERKENTSSRKNTTCSQCSRIFWYIDPRPGGRPRQKCGICSSRPPRYPWGFLDGERNEFDQEHVYMSEAEFDHKPVPGNGNPNHAHHARTREHTMIHSVHDNQNRRMITDDAVADPYPMPSPYASLSTRLEPAEMTPSHDSGTLARIEQKLDLLEKRLTALEAKVDERVSRSDWIDLCARLDIVEQLTTETLGQVRSRLESFGKEVRQIAVVPERELGEMFELVRIIRRQLLPDSEGNR